MELDKTTPRPRYQTSEPGAPSALFWLTRSGKVYLFDRRGFVRIEEAYPGHPPTSKNIRKRSVCPPVRPPVPS